MPAREVLFLQFTVLFVLALIHVFGDIYFLYWKYRWLDDVAHFLGGLWVGLFALWILVLRGRRPQFLICLAVVVGFGIAWELFELISGAGNFPAEIRDTVEDLAMDIIGGAASFLLIARLSSNPVKR